MSKDGDHQKVAQPDPTKMSRNCRGIYATPIKLVATI